MIIQRKGFIEIMQFRKEHLNGFIYCIFIQMYEFTNTKEFDNFSIKNASYKFISRVRMVGKSGIRLLHYEINCFIQIIRQEII